MFLIFVLTHLFKFKLESIKHRQEHSMQPPRSTLEIWCLRIYFCSFGHSLEIEYSLISLLCTAASMLSICSHQSCLTLEEEEEQNISLQHPVLCTDRSSRQQKECPIWWRVSHLHFLSVVPGDLTGVQQMIKAHLKSNRAVFEANLSLLLLKLSIPSPALWEVVCPFLHHHMSYWGQ